MNPIRDPNPKPCECSVDDCVLCEGHLFNGLKSDQVCEIRGLLDRRRYRPRETLFFEGSDSEYIFVIRSGFVKLMTSLADGREQILRVAVMGHLLGVEAMHSHVAPYTAEALTEVNVCQIRYSGMLKVLEGDAATSLRMIRQLTGELDRSQAMIRDLGLKNSTERVASLLVSMLPVNGTRATEILMPLSRREIAEIIGLTVETVSRQMAQLRRNGVIDEQPGKIRVADYPRLLELSGADFDPHTTASRV